MLVQECLAEAKVLREVYPALMCTVVYSGDNSPYVRIDGTVRLDREYEGIHLAADYELSIIIRESFPSSIPEVRLEEDSRPDSYPHINGDGTLCLGVNGEIAMVLSDSNSPLLAFFESVVVTNLYAIEYYRRYLTMPYGDRTHGDRGVLEFYREFFDVEDGLAVYQLLRAATARSRYRRREKCPCGSKLRASRCHAGHIDQLKYEVPRTILNMDYAAVVRALGLSDGRSIRKAASTRLRRHK